MFPDLDVPWYNKFKLIDLSYILRHARDYLAHGTSAEKSSIFNSPSSSFDSYANSFGSRRDCIEAIRYEQKWREKIRRSVEKRLQRLDLEWNEMEKQISSNMGVSEHELRLASHGEIFEDEVAEESNNNFFPSTSDSPRRISSSRSSTSSSSSSLLQEGRQSFEFQATDQKNVAEAKKINSDSRLLTTPEYVSEAPPQHRIEEPPAAPNKVAVLKSTIFHLNFQFKKLNAFN